MFKIYDGRETFYQWDINQKLIVSDDSITEVHFSNRTDNLSLVRDIYNEGDLRVVFVPNVLLQTNWPIKVYAYRKDHTEVSQTFKVIEKAKPQDYVYTPDEVKTWEELNDRVTALEKSGVSPEVIAKAVEDYLAEHPIAGNIVSVNGQTGEVVLTASDVGALPADTEIPSIAGLASTEYVDNAIANIPAPDLSNCVQTDKENILGDNGSIISNSSRGNSLTISNGVIEQKNSNQDSVSLGDAKVVFSHDTDGSSSTKGNGTFTMYGRKGEEYFKFNGTNGDVRVNGIATPTLSNDAVNKGYVDSQISNIAIPTVPTNVSAFTNDAGYLTAVPSEYVTETELNAKGYLTEHQSLADYALKSEIPSPYSLPTASATALGGVKVGTGLAIADDGTLSINIASAAVGQIIKVKAIDESGKPTAWEAADMPSGGGGGGTSEEFILLAEVTLEEDVKKVTLPLSSPTKHFITRMWCPKTRATSDPRYINIGINGSSSNLLYYLGSANLPSKDNKSQCTVEAHGLNDGNWAISAYTNLGDAEGAVSNYNQRAMIPIGVKNNGIMQAESVVFDVVTNDATQYFPVGSILRVWGV